MLTPADTLGASAGGVTCTQSLGQRRLVRSGSVKSNHALAEKVTAAPTDYRTDNGQLICVRVRASQDGASLGLQRMNYRGSASRGSISLCACVGPTMPVDAPVGTGDARVVLAASAIECPDVSLPERRACDGTNLPADTAG